jgi:hypothetical protein
VPPRPRPLSSRGAAATPAIPTPECLLPPRAHARRHQCGGRALVQACSTAAVDWWSPPTNYQRQQSSGGRPAAEPPRHTPLRHSPLRRLLLSAQTSRVGYPSPLRHLLLTPVRYIVLSVNQHCALCLISSVLCTSNIVVFSIVLRVLCLIITDSVLCIVLNVRAYLLLNT